MQTVLREIGEKLWSKAPDGSIIPDDLTLLVHPRSFLVIGRNDELIGEAGGPHVEKVRLFELFRRDVTEQEVVTFDELLATAEWVAATEAVGA